MTSLWRHSRLTYYDLGPNFLTQGVELLAGEVWQVSKRNSQYFRSYLRKTTGRGPFGPPPPSGARVKVSLPLNVLFCFGRWVGKTLVQQTSDLNGSNFKILSIATSKPPGLRHRSLHWHRLASSRLDALFLSLPLRGAFTSSPHLRLMTHLSWAAHLNRRKFDRAARKMMDDYCLSVGVSCPRG